MSKITNKKLKAMIKVKFEGDCEGYEVGFLVKDASSGSVIEFVKIDKFLLEELQWGLKVKFLLPCSYVCDISLVSRDTSGDSTQTSSMIYRCYPTSGTVMVNNK
ncbi:hypothetical protein ECANGB1_1635 [Enterospora canceri]|uniref:Uncharacterized protein n=1 Tax=Enterospora canceri TaxID=1081671 RepID=A0A1Y1S4Z4_9MICR|nr:hypothetical protein ECANGB1_1635 [Enterospora canceri]